MTRTCEQSIDKVTEILHTLVVWSNVFYILAALISFYGGHKTLGIIFCFIAVISVIHHTNWNIGFSSKTWGNIDVATATAGSLAILAYGLWFVFINRGLAIFKTRRTFMIGIFFVMLSLLALFVFGIALYSVKDIDPDDPEKGIFGPLTGAMKAGNVKKANELCYKRSKQQEYLIYHTIWHMLGGIVGVFFVTLITVH
jgi:hypothetical protein